MPKKLDTLRLIGDGELEVMVEHLKPVLTGSELERSDHLVAQGITLMSPAKRILS